MRAFLYLNLVLLTPLASADVPALMNKIVQLRSELESSNRELEAELKSRQAELDLWQQKRLELEGQMQKESLRTLQLDEKVKRLASRVKSDAKADPTGTSALNTWLDQAENWVRSSLPYRRGPRGEIIQSLRERLKRGLESPEILSAELWQFYDSEMKMALDNEYRITEVEDVGKAEVARLGLYTLFAKSAEGSIRQAVMENGRWSMKPVDSTTESDAERLLQNLKSKKDQGLYSIPAAQSIQVSKETL